LASAPGAITLAAAWIDVVVTGAAAEVTLQPKSDLPLARVGIAFQQLLGRHDHPRGTEAALQTMLIPEGLLQRMQRRALRQPFDGRDLRAIGLDREHGARLHGVPVELDGTRTAVAGIAPDVGSSQPGLFPDVIDQQRPRLDLVFVAGAIDRDRDPASHTHLL